jgi:hypothetical protein
MVPTVGLESGGQTDRSVSPPESRSSESGPTSASMIGAHVSARVANSQLQSQKENLHQLESMSRRLDAVASDKSVDELADHFQNLMGLDERVVQPMEAVTVLEFDIDSAQLHDVRRSEPDPGSFKYTAVLIDAAGQTLDVELTTGEGAEMYSLMQRIKSSPLLERVYRRIAMPMLDNIVQSARDKTSSP